jgi:hypothetical protein
MSFEIKSSKLTGIPDGAGWSQVFEYKPEDPDVMASKGQLFAVVSTNSLDGQVDSVRAGREILSKLQSEYFGTQSAGELESVTSGTIRLHPTGDGSNTKDTLQNLKNAVINTYAEFSKWEGVQIGAIVVLDKYIYLVSVGGAVINLMRSGVYVTLVKSVGEAPVAASGVLLAGDKYLIATKGFMEKSTSGVVKALVASKEIEAVSEYFAPIVHSSSQSGNMSMLIFQIADTGTQGDEPVAEKLISLAEEPVAKAHLIETETQETVGPGTVLENRPQFLSKAAGLFKQMFEPKIYLGQEVPDEASRKKRKLSATVGLLLIILLSVSIFFGVKQKKINDTKASYQKDLTEAQRNIEEAENLISLNPDRSRELFSEGKNTADKLLSEGVKDEELDILKGKIDGLQGRVLGLHTIQPETYSDLNLLSDGFSGTDIRLTEGILYAFDKNSRKVVKINISSKHTQVSAGPANISEGVTAMAAYLDNIYVFEKDGVYEVSRDKKKVLENSWSGNIYPYAYAANLYVVESSKSQIWRYTSGQEQFSDGKAWLSEEANIDLSNAIKVAIDGNIWVLNSDGVINRFSAGNQRNFNLPKDFRGVKFSDIYTSEELENVFLLDKEGSRVVAFTKDGEYEGQYVSEAIKNTTQIAVSGQEKKIILLNGSRLLSLPLND